MEQHLLSSNRAVINSKSMKLDFSSKATVATNPYTYEQVLLKAAGVPEQEIEQVLIPIEYESLCDTHSCIIITSRISFATQVSTSNWEGSKSPATDCLASPAYSCLHSCSVSLQRCRTATISLSLFLTFLCTKVLFLLSSFHFLFCFTSVCL